MTRTPRLLVAARKIAEADNPQIAAGGEGGNMFWEKYREKYVALARLVLATYGLADDGERSRVMPPELTAEELENAYDEEAPWSMIKRPHDG